MTEILIVGDSHVASIVEAARQLRESGSSPSADLRVGMLFSCPRTLSTFHRVVDDGVALVDRVATSRLVRSTGRSVISAQRGVVWAFAIGTTTTHFLRSATWNRYAPAAMADRLNRLPLSSGALDTICREYAGPALEFYADLVACGVSPLCVPAPPPRTDDKVLARGQPLELFLAVDNLLRAYVSARLHAIGVQCLEPPEAAYGPQRMLREELGTSGDAHHANAMYGALVIPMIVTAATPIRHAETVPS